MTPRVNVVTAAVAIVACLTSSAPAQASNYGFELNGIYRVTSNGDWARTNEVYRNEQTVTQTWTVHSNCANPEECSGAVNSDQGWSAPLRYVDDRWIVDRQILNWEPCPDGTAATGSQKYIFWGVGATGQIDATNTNLMAGTDTTIGPSGACGINKPLVIRLPIRMERLE